MPLNDACAAIAAIVADYRQGEIAPMNAAHVRRWIDQFPANVREPLAAELAHVLGKSYVSRQRVEAFLRDLVTDEGVVGDDPLSFWRGVSFLHVQKVGNSQRDMLALFDAALHARLGLRMVECGAVPHTYVYLDDAVFSGGRVKHDLIEWVNEAAPNKAKVAVIVMAIHSLGEWFASQDIAKAAVAASKTINVTWWRDTTIEDRKAYMTNSDVLRPKAIPAEAARYVSQLNAAPVLRTGNGMGPLGLFTSPSGRDLMEREFLNAGVRIRDLCPRLPPHMRPLGSTLMRTTGFGSPFVTHRNCANNTPLVFWAGNPWYPLFPRRINERA